MITKIIKYINEIYTIEKGPGIDDYVICIDKNVTDKNLEYFINTHIGQYDHYDYDYNTFVVKYNIDDVNEIIKNYPYIVKFFDEKSMYHFDGYKSMIYWSKDKEELEMILAAKNFNL